MKTAQTYNQTGSGEILFWISQLTILTYIIMISIFLGSFTYLSAQDPGESDKTLSPYFFVNSDDPELDQLPLKSTSAQVNIAGVIADVQVTQIYKNEGKKTLEAMYIFPASTRAAVYAMKMTIGERTIIAEIDKKSTARQRYEDAREEGYTAALLEQQRPNVFQMNVANILPGDVIKVELRYSELLIPEDKEYTFIYPTVVGPRYMGSSEQEDTGRHWVHNPYLSSGSKPSYDFALSVSLNAGMPVAKLASSSHNIDVTYANKNSARIQLDSSEQDGGNRDFILKYKLAGDTIQSGLLLYEGAKENFFMAMLQPPAIVSSKEVVDREYIFVLDVSGSMNGFPMSVSKTLMRNLLGQLRASEKFNILLFAGGSRLYNPVSVSANEENLKKAFYMIDNEQGAGGTELLPALKRALALPKTEGFARSIVIVTDGYVTVEREAFDIIRNNLGEASVFTFGIGSSVNRYLIEGLSRAGQGESFVITKKAEAQTVATKFRKYIQSPLLTKIRLTYEGFGAYAFEPVNIPDMFAERPVVVYGKYDGKESGNIRLIGTSAGGKKFEQKIDVGNFRPSTTNSALIYLWARQRIAQLSDYAQIDQDEPEIEEITSLGLTYNLLTRYTSFVAIDSELRNKGGEQTQVKQPLPLPQGVSDYAIGGGVLSGSASVSRGMLVKTARGGSKNDESLEAEVFEDIQVQLDSVTVSNNALLNDIKSLLNNYLPAIKYCYKRGLKTDPSNISVASIKVEIIFSSSGGVKAVNILRSTVKDSTIIKCFKGRIKGYAIPSFTDSAEMTVKAVYKFTPVN